MSDVTLILQAVCRGEKQVSEELLPLVYDELRQLATVRLSHESSGQTLQATALVHEAWLRLIGKTIPRSRVTPFLAAAGEAKRRIPSINPSISAPCVTEETSAAPTWRV